MVVVQPVRQRWQTLREIYTGSFELFSGCRSEQIVFQLDFQDHFFDGHSVCFGSFQKR